MICYLQIQELCQLAVQHLVLLSLWRVRPEAVRYPLVTFPSQKNRGNLRLQCVCLPWNIVNYGLAL
jgi:hypothetical protein